MDQKILKYNTLDRELKKKFSIEIPIGGKILCIHKDDKTKIPCIWALVDPDAEKEERFFELYKTDCLISNDDGYIRKYIGTYHHQRDEFIEHLFERVKSN